MAGVPIFSVDVHPDGKRFATAGSDHKVKIWSLLALLQARLDAKDTCARLLATLSDHLSPVNVARFSRAGAYLATGSDDAIICLYELRPGPAPPRLGSADPPNLENWRQVHALRGHRNNVTDVAWSVDDTMLASASLDNSVIVWDAASGAVRKLLRGHESYVKGVAWDPVGKYLASQSEDRSVRLWRVDNWTPVATVTEPFTKGWVSVTFSLRLDWSPDGRHVVAVNAFQPRNHTAPWLQRGSWKADHYMVGHSAAVVVARCNPHLFYPPGASPDDPQRLAVVCSALGSQDKRLTIWLANQPRPLAYARDFFRQSVVDLAWAPDGYTLLAASTDGTLAAFHMEPAELGERVPASERNAQLRELYGEARVRAGLLVESATQLPLEADAAQDADLVDPMPALPMPVPAGTSAPQPGLAARIGPGLQPTLLAKPPEPALPVEAATPVSNREQASLKAGGEGLAVTRRIQARPSNGPQKRSADGGSIPQQQVQRPAQRLAPQRMQDGSVVLQAGPQSGMPVLARMLSTSVPGSAAVPQRFEAVNGPLAGSMARQADPYCARVMCLEGQRRLWEDDLPSHVVAVAAADRFMVAGCQNGTLQASCAGKSSDMLSCETMLQLPSYICQSKI